jgi:hypothetical protein
MRKPISKVPPASAGEEPGPLSEFIKPTDEAIAVARPSTIEKLYIESEHEEAEAEQIANYGEKGENEAREAIRRPPPWSTRPTVPRRSAMRRSRTPTMPARTSCLRVASSEGSCGVRPTGSS